MSVYSKIFHLMCPNAQLRLIFFILVNDEHSLHRSMYTITPGIHVHVYARENITKITITTTEIIN